MPRLALFDLDNTLIDRVGLFRRWAAAFLERHGQPASDLSWLVEADGDGAVPRERFLEAVAQRYRLGGEVAALVEAYEREYPGFAAPPPRATFGALSALRDAGWRVAVVTNGPPMQERVVDATGLRGVADAVIVSSTVGLRKPDPAILALAATAAAATLDGAWMVGDSPDHDIGGAVKAGIRSVWLHRGRPWTEASFAPTLTADSVAQAIRHLLAASS